MIDPRLRQYMVTNGRTRAAADLPLEAPFQATVAAAELPLSASPEHRAIVRCCASPRTLVDLSSILGSPVGVLRVLVLDLVEHGLVRLHGRPAARAPHEDIPLLEEALHGIGRL